MNVIQMNVNCSFPRLLEMRVYHPKWSLYLSLQFQTTAPKSCYMRPPGGILAPGENFIATGNVSIFIALFPFLWLSYF